MMEGIRYYNTFIVSLAERSDRWANCLHWFNTLEIPFTGWTAIKNENGRLGLILTMKELFKYCLEKNYDKVLVFEDDCRFLNNDFKDIMAKCIQQLPADFDLFYPGCNLHGKCKKYSDNLLSAQGMYASHCILYSRTAIEKILPLLDTAQTYDILLVNTIQKAGRSYCAFPLLVSQVSGFSDIEGRNVNYEKFIEKRYEERTKHLL